MMEVYHGSPETIEHPEVERGRSGLDFGKGFYLTVYRRQAEDWALKKLRNKATSAVLNIYQLDFDAATREYRYIKFESYNREWLHFVVSCRNGEDTWKAYDMVEGGVADDRVIDTVNLYSQSFISEEEALRRLSMYSPNNQICIISQEIIDKHLHFSKAVAIAKDNDTLQSITVWNKIGHVVVLLAERLHISPNEALRVFYESEVCKQLHDPQTNLYLYSDLYIVDELVMEIQNR